LLRAPSCSPSPSCRVSDQGDPFLCLDGSLGVSELRRVTRGRVIDQPRRRRAPFQPPFLWIFPSATLGATPKPVGINSTRVPTRRPTRRGSRGIPCTEPTTPQPHVYPHLIEPRQILWILCGFPTTRKPHICLHLAGPLQIRPGSFVAATQLAMWAATCAWVSL
jgi:hypothetical protein